jgi:hypothetical protein
MKDGSNNAISSVTNPFANGHFHSVPLQLERSAANSYERPLRPLSHRAQEHE